MGDTIRFIIHQLDSPSEIIDIPRSFLRGCLMKKEAFAQHYEHLAQVHNRVIAYEQLEDLHERLFGRPRYSDYDSFRVARNKKRNRALKQPDFSDNSGNFERSAAR